MFGFHFGWFPTEGSVAPGTASGSLPYVMSKIYHILLPALSMALITTVTTVQYLRSEIIDTKQKDFIITAQSERGFGGPRLQSAYISQLVTADRRFFRL